MSKPDLAAAAAWTKEPAASMVLQQSYAAAAAVVERLPILANTHDTGEDIPETAWTDDVALGFLMLVARLVRRRNSPNGVEALTDSGVTYVARYDSDISRLLQIDAFQKPAVG